MGRSCEKASFELGVIEGVADGESDESSEDNDLLDSACERRGESVMQRLTQGCLREQLTWASSFASSPAFELP